MGSFYKQLCHIRFPWGQWGLSLRQINQDLSSKQYEMNSSKEAKLLWDAQSPIQQLTTESLQTVFQFSWKLKEVKSDFDDLITCFLDAICLFKSLVDMPHVEGFVVMASEEQEPQMISEVLSHSVILSIQMIYHKIHNSRKHFNIRPIIVLCYQREQDSVNVYSEILITILCFSFITYKVRKYLSIE